MFAQDASNAVSANKRAEIRKFRHKVPQAHPPCRSQLPQQALGLLTGQVQSILMNLFMMWMAGALRHVLAPRLTAAGNQLSIWSIFMIAAVFFTPLKSLLGIQASECATVLLQT